MNPHASHSATLLELMASFWRNRKLAIQLTRRDVIGRYKGSFAGMAWSFFNPLLMLAVYTFVFSVVFNARWGSEIKGSHAGFAIVMFVGMIVHGLLAECVNKAPGLILSNANYVKKVIFPLEILPWVAIGSALFHAAVSLVVLLVAQAIFGHGVPWTAIFSPLVIAPLSGFIMGLTWFLSATSVYVRDIAQVTGILTSSLMFLAPVFYPIEALPQYLQRWIYLNPLTFVIEQARLVLIAGQLPDWSGLFIYSLVSGAFAWMGFWWFQRARKGFSDVI